MLTVQWQALTPDLGAAVPEEVAAAGCGDLYRGALERSRAEYDRLAAAGHAEAAPYALCLGYRMRYLLDMNAREAMHLIELRSGREGHPGYRAVAHEMHALIAEHHPAVAATMTHVDTRRGAPPRADPRRDAHASGSARAPLPLTPAATSLRVRAAPPAAARRSARRAVEHALEPERVGVLGVVRGAVGLAGGGPDAAASG